jgi:hypothetical protein
MKTACIMQVCLLNLYSGTSHIFAEIRIYLYISILLASINSAVLSLSVQTKIYFYTLAIDTLIYLSAYPLYVSAVSGHPQVLLNMLSMCQGLLLHI